MKSLLVYRLLLSVVTFCILAAGSVSAAETTILNASYDVARGLYKDLNTAFQLEGKAKSGEDLTIGPLGTLKSHLAGLKTQRAGDLCRIECLAVDPELDRIIVSQYATT